MTTYGAHIYLFTRRWGDDQVALLDHYAELGLTCVEIAVGDDVSFDPALTRRRAEANGLEVVVSPGALWPMRCDLSADEAGDRAAGLAWHKRQVDLGAELGAIAYTGAIYGHPGAVKRRRPPADEMRWAAEGLHHLAAYAQPRGLTVALEPMSHFRTHLVNNHRQLLRLLATADHENLMALFDTYHVVTEERDYGAALRALGDRLWGLHACENDRGVPGGGLVPWTDIFQALRDIAFDGYMILETYNSSLGDFAFERGMFHNVCPDGDAFVREGVRFLKAQAAAT